MLPCYLAALSATTGPEQIIVQLVIACGVCAVEDCWRSALQTDDHCGVFLVGEDMPSQTISLPAEIISVIEATLNRLPLSIRGCQDVGVCGHLGECQDSALIGDVWPRDLIRRPRR